MEERGNMEEMREICKEEMGGNVEEMGENMEEIGEIGRKASQSPDSAVVIFILLSTDGRFYSPVWLRWQYSPNFISHGGFLFTISCFSGQDLNRYNRL